jgi:hypothetical protein
VTPQVRPLAVVLAALLALAAAACKPVVDVDGPSLFDEDDPAALAPARADRGRLDDDADDEREPPPPPLRTSGTVERADLDRILDAGPASFLARIEIQPHLDIRQRFRGWEVVSYGHGGIDLRPGDVITSVNKNSLERPQQLEKLWSQLRSADAIEVRGERSGQSFVMRFEVVGEPGVTGNAPTASP